MGQATRIKVCGLSDAAAARSAVAAGADYLGLVFAASVRQVTPATAESLVTAVPAAWVGVFVNPSLADAVALTDRLGLAVLQLHGEETPAECQAVRDATGRPVWKGLRWTGAADLLVPWAGAVDGVVLDAGAGAERGGTGRTLPWRTIGRMVPAARRPVPLILAGGLGPDNVAIAIAAVRPDGVDGSSRLERAPGRKDPARIHAFVRAVRGAAPAAVAGAR
ncbi:MAG: N-(5'-phosphoribosyl)anthranilate isomerase [Gemmatimonadota bacterium]